MKKSKNLNEEINRIKSLFAEERLYGNLVDNINIKEQKKNITTKKKTPPEWFELDDSSSTNDTRTNNVANSRNDPSYVTGGSDGYIGGSPVGDVTNNRSQDNDNLAGSTGVWSWRTENPDYRETMRTKGSKEEKEEKDQIKKDYEENFGNVIDQSGGIGYYNPNADNYGRVEPPPLTDDCKPDHSYNSSCNDNKILNCKNQGLIAHNRTELGSKWDEILEMGWGYMPNGKYNSLFAGHSDNKKITKCWCSSGSVGKRKRPCGGKFMDGYDIVTFESSVVDTYFIEGRTTMTAKDPLMMNAQSNETPEQKKYRLEDSKQQYYKDLRKFQSIKSSKQILSDKALLHTILEIVEVVALAVPIVGILPSVLVGSLNAALYFEEGDKFAAGLSILFALAPGGNALRKGIKSQKMLQSLDQTVHAVQKMGLKSGEKGVVESTFKNMLMKNGVAKTSQAATKILETNKKLIDNYFTILTSEGAENILKTSTKSLQDLVKVTGNEWKAFLKNEDLLKSYMNAYKGRLDAAYGAYLKSLNKFPVGAMTKNAAIYLALMEGLSSDLVKDAGTDLTKWAIETYQNTDFTTIGLPISTTKSRAKEGKIKDIVELAGYNWDSTKEVFGSDSKIPDNRNLKKAWLEGWRPYDKNNPEGEVNYPDVEFEKYWTPTYKKYVQGKSMLKDKLVTDEDGTEGYEIEVIIGGGEDSVVDDENGKKTTIPPIPKQKIIIPKEVFEKIGDKYGEEAADMNMKSVEANSGDKKHDIEKTQELEKINKNLKN